MNLPFFVVEAFVPGGGGVQNQAEYGGSRIRPKKNSSRYRYQNLLFQGWVRKFQEFRVFCGISHRKPRSGEFREMHFVDLVSVTFGDKFGKSLVGSQASQKLSPRTSPEVPRTSPEVFGDFPTIFLTVELNSNPEVPRKFPQLPRKFPKLPRKFPKLPRRSAPLSRKPDTLSWVTKTFSETWGIFRGTWESPKLICWAGVNHHALNCFWITDWAAPGALLGRTPRSNTSYVRKTLETVPIQPYFGCKEGFLEVLVKLPLPSNKTYEQISCNLYPCTRTLVSLLLWVTDLGITWD